MPGGRPTILTREVLAELTRVLSSGCHIETACHFVGVSKPSMHRWVRAGQKLEADIEAGVPIDPERREREQIYLEFRHALKESIAKAEIGSLATIRNAAKEKWQAAAWILERRFPDRWGRTIQQVEHGEAQDKAEDELDRLLADPEARDALRRAANRAAALEGYAGRDGKQAGKGKVAKRAPSRSPQ
ncbi:MAG: hypothetical protein GTO22_14375 [Gemmatimonadales bacterium]|nr:hypothetical protein [Gemmatimonadales bacterium]